MKNREGLKNLLRNFLLESVIYGVLLVVYFFLVLRLLSDLLTDLFATNLVVYSILALALIIGQGVLLEQISSFILDQIRIDRVE
jgi:hypothetical protein